MNVRLAVQLLSVSVASRLLFCKSKRIAGFENPDSRAEFCLNLNNAFDILNSRKFFAKYEYNELMKTANIEFFRTAIADLTRNSTDCILIECLTFVQ